MRGLQRLRDCLNSSKGWLLSLLGMDALFILFAWLAYPPHFKVLVYLMVLCSLVVTSIPLAFLYHRQKRCEAAFDAFELEPTEDNEAQLCRAVPATARTAVRKLGALLRASRAAQTETSLHLVDYEQYIEAWVHEVKTPLSLMTLILDNRTDEISPYVYQRLQHVHNRIQEDTEKILYFARLKAVHKDYVFEPLDLLVVCQAAIDEQQVLLNEAKFTVELDKIASCPLLSDYKGLAFILRQIISNSIKYAGVDNAQPKLRFEIDCDTATHSAVLRINDNGPGVPQADLPFIFDKGFTGGRGGRGGNATGMGLFLVQRMAHDLAIELETQSQPNEGLTISLHFPDAR